MKALILVKRVLKMNNLSSLKVI